MNKFLITTVASLIISAPAFAEKPATAGKGKPEHIEARQDLVNSQAEKHVQPKAEPYRLTEEEKRHFEAKKNKADKEMKHTDSHKDHDRVAGKDKQHDKKADQIRKEEGKGSEQGQASREEHSKKWWKFW